MKGLTIRTHNETLRNMLNFYKVVIPGETNAYARSVASALIKEYLSCLWSDDELDDKQMEYVQGFDITQGEAAHRAFCDILERWCVS